MAMVHITITEDDIRQGNGKIGCLCPGFRAIQRVLPSVQWVGIGNASFYDGTVVEFPEWVAAYIENFYDGIPTEPFNFDWEVPDNLIPSNKAA